MEFFNEKEEVIDLQLTQFGRHLLSKGRFKPAFYSFFDDDILYNVEAAPISAKVVPAEEQNSSHERIYKAWDGSASTDYGAPRMKPQISFNSLERDFLSNYNKVVSGQEDPGDPGQQPAAIKNYALPQPMGTMAINKENAPAIQVNFLEGQISSSINHLQWTLPGGGSTTLKVPQLESEITLEYIETEGDDFYEIEDPSMSFGVVTSPDQMMIFLKILEKNAPYQKENFDIEVFEVIEEAEGNNTKAHELRQLQFKRSLEMVEDFDFLKAGWVVPPATTQDNVEYYMELLTDEEVKEEICRLDPNNLDNGVFTDNRAQQCIDIINEDDRKTFDIYEDEIDDPGEIC